jgi:hypothetical protein
MTITGATFPPRAPRIIKGGIALLNPNSFAVIRVIALQYNPDSLTRSLQVQGAGGEAGDHMEALRLKGPPIETIKLEAEIDAVDQLEGADARTVMLGIHPQLALLESTVYPSSAQLVQSHSIASSGGLEIAPAQAPLTLLIWSAARILPVRLTDFSITEEAFDTALNPIRAKISLGMRVLSVNDLGFDNKGGNLFLGYLQRKEQLAQMLPNSEYKSIGITGIP